MTRVSLKEAYDNKDVVAQIYAIRDIAEGASDTADNASTTASDAKTYVDNLGVQVEGAVQTANNASASAQASAQTVSQYDARLTEVEGDLNQAESDIDGLETGLGAVTARVTTAEGNIVTIQGRVTALETADGQNVKINDISQYALALTDNQTFRGTKEALDAQHMNVRPYLFQRVNAESKWFKVFSYPNANRRIITMSVTWAHQSYSGGGVGLVMLGCLGPSTVAKWLYRQSNATAFTADSVFVGITLDNTVEIWVKAGYYVYCGIERVIRGNVEDAIGNTTNAYDGVGVTAMDESRFSTFSYGSD